MDSFLRLAPHPQVVHFNGAFHRFVFHRGEPMATIINLYSRREVQLQFRFHEDTTATLSISNAQADPEYPSIILDSRLLLVNMCRYVNFEWNGFIENMHGINQFDVVVFLCTNFSHTDAEMLAMVNRLGFVLVASYTGINRENGKLFVGKRNNVSVQASINSVRAEIEIEPPHLYPPLN